MITAMLVAIGIVAGLFVGTVWGRKLEQKAIGIAISEYEKAGRINRNVLAELKTKLPWLERHL